MKAIYNKNTNTIVVKFKSTNGTIKKDELKILPLNDNKTYVLNGERKLSNEKDGLLVKSYYNEKGQLHGEQTEYYDNNRAFQNVKRITNWNNNRKHGVETYYYESKTTEKLYNWENGLANGIWYEYYDIKIDGVTYKKSQKTYKNGVKHGKFNEWYENKDEMSPTVYYLNGKKVTEPDFIQNNNKDIY
ncbi:hypothetical protein HUN03_00240 [Mycoplasmopsis anatis]|uniref:Phophatidylinositol-4-phosphate 5-kinase n=2 Tax=Mycoplasmopsis anatis TaxID=171279 RepID=F9QDU6_9BACT|nr:hypothetical protein [Mycoplasmopsis anatis]AWX69881.1 hypothetical protein DP067_00630 [Mycoplasmopsis anatis]EGS29123.1 hypothetical protein GIG_02858 [Mycoplasmopsis anatis 1340]MBW0594800.1 hypothetical protein [Mycoplasmopsis anatis]MBW0595410.1 hypothetical protein [Mycoplasmopsis anatis]MBW0595833.1 hypothetical protein [Mycoplasmopsis anatis]